MNFLLLEKEIFMIDAPILFEFVEDTGVLSSDRTANMRYLQFLIFAAARETLINRDKESRNSS